MKIQHLGEDFDFKMYEGCFEKSADAVFPHLKFAKKSRNIGMLVVGFDAAVCGCINNNFGDENT